MDLYNSFLFLVLGLLAVSRPSAESQIGGRIGEINPVEVSVRPFGGSSGNSVKGKLLSRDNKNEGISKTDPIRELSIFKAFSHSNPSQTVEGVNRYGGRISDRNADLEESAPIENYDQSALSRLEKLKSALGKKEEPRKTSKPINIDYSKSEGTVILYDSLNNRVPCDYIIKSLSSSTTNELVLGRRVGEEYQSRGEETMYLYEKPDQLGKKYIINIPKLNSNLHKDEIRKMLESVDIKVEPISST